MNAEQLEQLIKDRGTEGRIVAEHDPIYEVCRASSYIYAAGTTTTKGVTRTKFVHVDHPDASELPPAPVMGRPKKDRTPAFPGAEEWLKALAEELKPILERYIDELEMRGIDDHAVVLRTAVNDVVTSVTHWTSVMRRDKARAAGKEASS